MVHFCLYLFLYFHSLVPLSSLSILFNCILLVPLTRNRTPFAQVDHTVAASTVSYPLSGRERRCGRCKRDERRVHIESESDAQQRRGYISSFTVTSLSFQSEMHFEQTPTWTTPSRKSWTECKRGTRRRRGGGGGGEGVLQQKAREMMCIKVEADCYTWRKLKKNA